MIKILSTITFLAFSFSVLAQKAFEGKWQSTDSKIRLYGEDRTADYYPCPLDLEIKLEDNKIIIQKLHSICDQSDYWIFNQKLPVVTMIIREGGILYSEEGRKVGTISTEKMDFEHDEYGQMHYIEGKIKNGIFHFGWYARNYGPLNFDVTTEFKR